MQMAHKKQLHTNIMSQVSDKRINEASSLLMVWSFFALVEGTIRMTLNSKPVDGVDYFDNAGGTKIPVIVFLLGGVAEVIFGMFGFFVGFHSHVFGHNSPLLTKVFVLVQAILGWFVFLTYVVAAPIKDAMNTDGVPGLLSSKEHGLLIIMGNLLGSVAFCYALQGGQFIMGLRLLAAQTGQPEVRSKNVIRSTIWCVNLLLASVSTLYVGFVLQAKGFTSTTGPVGAPPHVVWFPILSIITGFIMLVFTFVAYWSTYEYSFVKKVLPVTWVVTTLAMMANFSWSFGIVPGLAPPIPGSAQHLGLVLSVTILPVYHAYRAHHLVDADESCCDGSKDTTANASEQPRKIAYVEDVSELDA